MPKEDASPGASPSTPDGAAPAEAAVEASDRSFPLIVLAVPLVFAQLMGTRHMKGQVLKLMRDPHVWLPWINKNPWKNPTSQWWWNKKAWINNEPWKNPKPWTPPKKNLF
uniref:Uncharacterized protein n=1 Tax=Hemiselmis andersenii TaxID=464988 RepID=A0A6U2FJK9_HEMAN|mmetsp:Transcript_3265/g.7539  ORF Transcript_3265/g.7539 Transcript_3265/m.7539 type:complete len:110 (+) Transcript_3265:41-370(+)